MRGLIVAGSPEPSSPELVARLADRADYIIAADSGADLLKQAGRLPDLFCGDEDSADETSISWVEHLGLPEKRFPWRKDDTDLGLAFRFAMLEAEQRSEPLDLVVSCVSGGRCDHALGVFGVIAEHAGSIVSSGGSLVLEEDAYTCTILPAGSSLEFHAHDNNHIFSALSLAQRSVVTEEGMLWSVEHSVLGLLDDRGVSNRITSDCAKIICHEGLIAAFLLHGDATYDHS